MSMIAQQTETLIEQIRAGGETTFAAIRALIRVAMRVRQHWLPRGTIDVTASLGDLSPALTAQVQSHVENVIIGRLKNSPQEQEQILLVNALSQWGGEHSANYLSEQVLAGKFTEEVVNQCLVAFGILGGPNSVTALVSTMMHGNERLVTNADRNLSELADGGSEDMLQSSAPFSIVTVDRILRSVNFAAIPIDSGLEFNRGLLRVASFLERRCDQPDRFWPVFKSVIHGDNRVAMAAVSFLSESAAMKSFWSPPDAIKCVARTTSDIAIVGQLFVRSGHAETAEEIYRERVSSGSLGNEYKVYISNRRSLKQSQHKLFKKRDQGTRCTDSEVSAYICLANQQGSLCQEVEE